MTTLRIRPMGCLVLAVLGCCLALASPAAAAEKAILGPTKLPGGESSFPLLRSLGVDTYETTLDWSSVAPRRPKDPRNPDDPAYLWPRDVDQGVSEARQDGVRVGLLVSRSPSWANGG